MRSIFEVKLLVNKNAHYKKNVFIQGRFITVCEIFFTLGLKSAN